MTALWPSLRMPRRLRRVQETVLRRLYYRFAFGRRGGWVARWGAAVSALEATERSGDAPRPRSIWEAEYASDIWSNLAGLRELSRYSVIAGIAAAWKPDGAVLDVGCGEALLRRYLPESFGRYVGVDLAESALERARECYSTPCTFVRADAQDFDPGERFDVIVFNEVLYYFNEPLAVVARYARALAPQGMVIASLYQKSMRARAIKRALLRRYSAVSVLRIASRGEVWDVIVFAPHDSPRAEGLYG